MSTLLIAFVVALAVAGVATPLVRMAARSVGMVARPSADRWHHQPTALLGGIGIFAGCGAGVVAALVWLQPPDAMVASDSSWLGILGAAVLMFGAGVLDDHIDFQPASKLVFQTVAATVLVGFGAVLPVTSVGPLNILLTVFWFITVTNALNLLDNMDGVTAGVAAIAALCLAAVFWHDGNLLLAGICAAMAGAALGFLPYNFHPASIFMGDSGALFMGALLAGLAAAQPASASSSVIAAMFVPALIIVVPLVDTALVSFTRMVAGRRISVGGRDHAAHRLVAMGLSERQVALTLYCFAAAGGVMAVTMYVTRGGFELWLGSLFLTAMLVLAAYLTRLHGYPEGERPRGRSTILVSEVLFKRRALEVVLDVGIFAIAYAGAFLLRFDGAPPMEQLTILNFTLPVLVGVQTAVFGAFGVYRGFWEHYGMSDMHRLIRAVALGSILSVAVVAFAFPDAHFSRSVFVIDALLVAVLTLGVRFSVRSLESVRSGLQSTGQPVIVYGAGAAGELVVRELRANPALGMVPVAFLDDDSNKHGRVIHGLPVMGGIKSLDRVVARFGPTDVIVGTAAIDPTHLRLLNERCSHYDLRVLKFTVELRVAAGIERVEVAVGNF